jgi:hypothetical protein
MSDEKFMSSMKEKWRSNSLLLLLLETSIFNRSFLYVMLRYSDLESFGEQNKLCFVLFRWTEFVLFCFVSFLCVFCFFVYLYYFYPGCAFGPCIIVYLCLETCLSLSISVGAILCFMFNICFGEQNMTHFVLVMASKEKWRSNWFWVSEFGLTCLIYIAFIGRNW